MNIYVESILTLQSVVLVIVLILLLFGFIFFRKLSRSLIAFMTETKKSMLDINLRISNIETIMETSVLNNIDMSIELNKIIQSVLGTLPNETTADKALWVYFNRKYHHIIENYKLIRESGITMLMEEGFMRNLLGSGTVELGILGCFNPDFVNKIDKLNEKNYSEFFKELILTSSIKETDQSLVLKSLTLKYFKKNIEQIFCAYKETPIKQSDKEENTNISIVRDLICKGLEGTFNAIDYISETEMMDKNTLSIFKGRANDLLDKQSINAQIQTELSKLNHDILQFLTTNT